MADVTGRAGYQLKRAQHALRMAMDEALRELGATTPQYAALSALDASGPLSGADLARRCYVTPQTMNAIVVNLERNRWVERLPRAEHGRVIETHLTTRGRSLLRRAHAAVGGVESRMVRGIAAVDRDTLINMLRRCADNLSATPQ
ncbi:MAG: MarR family transcriptional regulator [Gemmatimonadaceae bacterium]|nr:MarR family transcriptional regulator [Gemmatimonadaceae bacterium]